MINFVKRFWNIYKQACLDLGHQCNDIGSIIGAGASIIGGVLGSKSSEKAANIQAQAAGQTSAENARQFDLSREDMAPWLTTGKEGLYALADLLGLNTRQAPIPPARADFTKKFANINQGSRTGTVAGIGGFPIVSGVGGARSSLFDQAGYDAAMAQYEKDLADYKSYTPSGELMRDFSLEDFVKEPGYEFRLSEGEKGINRAALARGGFDSGATLKALQRFGQDYASDEYSTAWTRDEAEKNRKYNFLAGISRTGQTTANQVASLRAQNAAAQSELMTGAANARAAGVVGGANAWGNALSNIQQQLTLAQLMQGDYGGGKGYSTWRNPDTGNIVRY